MEMLNANPNPLDKIERSSMVDDRRVRYQSGHSGLVCARTNVTRITMINFKLILLCFSNLNNGHTTN